MLNACCTYILVVSQFINIYVCLFCYCLYNNFRANICLPLSVEGILQPLPVVNALVMRSTEQQRLSAIFFVVVSCIMPRGRSGSRSVSAALTARAAEPTTQSSSRVRGVRLSQGALTGPDTVPASPTLLPPPLPQRQPQ